MSQTIRLVCLLILFFTIGKVMAMGSSSDIDDAGDIDIVIMVVCNTEQEVSTANKAANSSNYCSFDGRYVAKPDWGQDSGSDGKNLIPYNTYKLALNDTKRTNYRLPTINELLRLVNFDNAEGEIFKNYPVVNTWLKDSEGAFINGYLLSNTFDPVTKYVYGLDVRSRNVVQLDPAASYESEESSPSTDRSESTGNISPTPFNRPLYVLGVSDYFQIINKGNNKCVEFSGHNVALALKECKVSEIKQRWQFDAENQFINQYRNTESEGVVELYCMGNGDFSDTRINAFKCNESSNDTNFEYEVSIDVTTSTGLIAGVAVKLKASDESLYLTKNENNLKTQPSSESDDQLWILQY